MKKLVLSLLMLLVFATYAGVESPFEQFTQDDYHDEVRPDQSWPTVQAGELITLGVHANSGVWLSNYVSNWFSPIPDLHGAQYNMVPASVRYGYIFKDDLDSLDLTREEYEDYIHWAEGGVTTITYYDDANPNLTNSTTGYFLDYFDNAAEIYLVMTTLTPDGGELVDSYQYVQDADHDTTLVSRQHNTIDIAGNVRVNFGIDSETYGRIGREFVAVYATGDEEYIRSQLSGGPLPGVFFAGLLSLGTVFGASRLRRQKRA